MLNSMCILTFQAESSTKCADLLLSPALLLQHTAAPTNVMGMLSVSVRQTSKGGDTVTLDPVTMMTMMTCKSKESAQGLLKSLNG